MDFNDNDTEGRRYTRDERLRNALKILRDGRVSLLDFILHILRSNKDEFTTYQERFFANPSGKLTQLLDYIFEDKCGRPTVLSWMEPRVIDLVLDKITKEMDNMKAALMWSVTTTTPENLLAWDIDTFIGPLIDSNAPILSHLLRVAAETKRAKENNRIKSCTTV